MKIDSSQGSICRLLMVSTSYPHSLSDWRGLFIRHLADGLARRIDLQLSLWSPPGEMPPGTEYAASPDEAKWLKDLMASGGIANLMRRRSIRGLTAPFHLLRILRAAYRRLSRATDLYHVNWLQNALVLPNDRHPALVTVLGTDMQLLSLPGMAPLLRRTLGRRNTTICPNAAWMVPELDRRFGDIAAVRFVPFGIAPGWFAMERRPVSPDRWLCVSRVTRGKIGKLFEWGEPYFASGNRELHLLGPMQEQLSLPSWVHFHGPATPEALCKTWFPEAKGLITLSQHAEGRPQVMLEAMAAGLPIIATRIPAHEDLLTHGATGWLCASPAELGKAFVALDERDRNLETGKSARTWVRQTTGTWDDCASRYAGIYAELMAR